MDSGQHNQTMGSNQGNRDHRRPCDAGSYSPLRFDPTQIFSGPYHWSLKGKSASEVMSFGSKSSRMVRGRTFWARGYCVSTVGLDEEKIREYIRNQEHLDKLDEEPEL